MFLRAGQRHAPLWSEVAKGYSFRNADRQDPVEHQEGRLEEPKVRDGMRNFPVFDQETPIARGAG